MCERCTWPWTPRTSSRQDAHRGGRRRSAIREQRHSKPHHIGVSVPIINRCAVCRHEQVDGVIDRRGRESGEVWFSPFPHPGSSPLPKNPPPPPPNKTLSHDPVVLPHVLSPPLGRRGAKQRLVPRHSSPSLFEENEENTSTRSAGTATPTSSPFFCPFYPLKAPPSDPGAQLFLSSRTRTSETCCRRPRACLPVARAGPCPA